MNAFGAQLQNAAYKEGFKDFVIFSSWLQLVHSSPACTWIHGCLWVHVFVNGEEQAKVLTDMAE
jgi:hypothetical protein